MLIGAGTDETRYVRDFEPTAYLAHYYSANASTACFVTIKETHAVIDFLVNVCRPLLPQHLETMLELGGGPAVYQLLPFADRCRDIHFTDLLLTNLDEVQLWKREDASGFDWSSYARYCVTAIREREPGFSYDASSLQARLREGLRTFGICNVFDCPITPLRETYELINCHFVPESATTSLARWESAMHNIKATLTPEGLLFMSALRGASGAYRIGDKLLPAVAIDERHVESVCKSMGLRVIYLNAFMTDCRNRYNGILLLVAQRAA